MVHVRSELGMSRYLADQADFSKRNAVRRSLFIGPFDPAQLSKCSLQAFQSFNFPEISHFYNSFPTPKRTFPEYPGEFAEFYFDEYSTEYVHLK